MVILDSLCIPRRLQFLQEVFRTSHWKAARYTEKYLKQLDLLNIGKIFNCFKDVDDSDSISIQCVDRISEGSWHRCLSCHVVDNMGFNLADEMMDPDSLSEISYVKMQSSVLNDDYSLR